MSFATPTYQHPLRKLENPVLQAIKSSDVAKRFVGRQIDDRLLEEIGVMLSKASRCECEAYHEVNIVPSSVGMICARVQHTSGQTWVVSVAKIPQ
jgi:hypothetical protein